ncbi:retrovirus-related pol polyprotein from transposon TNT 1-94 [Tanacetum coccineum]
MFDEYLEPPRVERPVSPALAVPVPVNSAAGSTIIEDNPFAPVDNNPFEIKQASQPLDNVIANPLRLYPQKTTATRCLVIASTMQRIKEFFDRLQVWELVPRPDYVMIIALKWIYKVKLDEYGDVLKNKARLVAKGYRQEEGIDFKESLHLHASRL